MGASRPGETAPQPTIVQYWHSERPPAEVVAALASFAELNPGMRHMVFNEAKAAEFIGEHFSARELSAFQTCAIPAMQADYFRYCAILVLGGIYADGDLECTADTRPLIERAVQGILFGREDTPPHLVPTLYGWPYAVGPFQAVGNGLFAFARADHPILRMAVEIATANIERRIADGPRGVWLTAGPGIFTSMYLLHRLGSIDAFLRYAEESVLKPSARLFCEIVEDTSRVAELVERAAILPRRECRAWVTPIKVPPRCRGVGVPWRAVEGSIYR